MIMTQHPSLKIKGAGAEHRSVLKRFERILRLQKEEKWEESDPIFGLPKVKTTRLKIKKEKAAPTPEEVAAAAAAEGAEGAAPGEGAEGVTPETTEKTSKAEKGGKVQSGKLDRSKEVKSGQESGKKPDKKK